MLVPGVTDAWDDDSFREALQRIDFGGADLVVVLSPHGSATGVYRGVAGSLDGFGVTGIEVKRETDPAFVDALAAAWGAPVLDEPIDHGVLVPLLLSSLPDAPVVGACLADWTEDHHSLRRVLDRAQDFAAALPRLSDRRVGFVASGHSSAALSPRAPLTERPQGHRAHTVVTEALRSGGGLDDVAPDLWQEAGSCGAGPLVALTHLFRGRKADLMAFADPFGVGYLIAAVG